MEYNDIVKKIDAFINKNMDILQLLYPREFDCEYSSIINDVKNGCNLEQIRNEIETFFKFQGMSNEERTNLLRIFDSEKEGIRNIKEGETEIIYKLYCKLLTETKNITGKFQYVDTSKLMNLYNQNIPLFDNNVINFLKHINVNIKNRTKEAYLVILNIYKLINKETNIPNIIKLKNIVYSDMEIEYINLNKFVDTLLYFINDTRKLKKHEILCKYKKGKTVYDDLSGR
jgi:hypothetical protein